MSHDRNWFRRHDDGRIELRVLVGDIVLTAEGTNERGRIVDWRHVDPDSFGRRSSIVDDDGVTVADGNVWDEATTWLNRGASFAAAVGSKIIEGAAPLAAINHRHQCCHGVTLEGVVVSEPCPARRLADDGHHYCGACGCPRTRIARIDVDADAPTKSKLAYPKLACHRFGAVAGVRKAAHNGACVARSTR